MTGPTSRDAPFHVRMLAKARELRAAADNAWLPAVRQQLMSRVIEYENAAVGAGEPARPGEPGLRAETTPMAG